jgi:chloramphenicol-sensitive protein RarD
VSQPGDQFKLGVAAAAGAYFWWGLFPIFWKLLEDVSSLELMAHRIVWCALTMMIVLSIGGQSRFWRGVSGRVLLQLACSAALIAVNWWVYIWAVTNGKIVESSLGYFINPLVSVMLGVVFFRERLHPRQWLAVAIAGAGVAYLTIQAGAPPWIALALAFSFGLYGLVRKVAVIDAPRGLALESLWLLAPAIVVLTMMHARGDGHFGGQSARIDLLLLATGPLTAAPLLLFALGARRIPLSLIGILQYIAPTLQFLTGVLLYGEPFTRVQAIGFGLIWAALALYAADSLHRYARARL